MMSIATRDACSGDLLPHGPQVARSGSDLGCSAAGVCCFFIRVAITLYRVIWLEKQSGRGLQCLGLTSADLAGWSPPQSVSFITLLDGTAHHRIGCTTSMNTPPRFPSDVGLRLEGINIAGYRQAFEENGANGECLESISMFTTKQILQLIRCCYMKQRDCTTHCKMFYLKPKPEKRLYHTL